MTSEARHAILAEADLALQREEPKAAKAALGRLGTSIDYDAVALMLRAAARIRDREADDALGDLRRALELEPESAKARFALAELQFDTRAYAEALATIEPLILSGNASLSARQLHRRIGRMVATYAAKEGQRPLLGLGEKWTYLGYGIFMISMMTVVLWHAQNPLTLVQATDSKDGWVPQVRSGLFGSVQIGLYLAAAGVSLVWMVLDIADRRGRFLWVIPQVLFGFCGIFPLPFALYLFAGRKVA